MGPVRWDAGPAGGVSLLSAGVGLLPGAGLIYFTLGLPGSTGRAAILKIALLALAFPAAGGGGAVCGVFYGPVYPGSLFPRVGGTGRGAAVGRPVGAGDERVPRGAVYDGALLYSLYALLIFIAPAVFVLPYEWAAFGLFSRFLADRLSREEAAGHARDAG